MKTLRKKINCILVSAALLLTMLGLPGCGKEEPLPEGSVPVYYVSNTETRTEIHYRVLPQGETEAQIDAMLGFLGEIPEKLEYKAPLNMGFALLSYSFEYGKLTLDMDESYRDLVATSEVLVRSAIVRSIAQIEGVKAITFTVNGSELTDRMGKNVGWMTADTFISNDGNEINTYEQARIKLYFATVDGTALIPAYREKFYSTSMPIERFVVEELISGPSGQIEGLYPTVQPTTKIISISTRDGVCYLNLDNTFLTVENNVSTELAVISIVNSLTSLDTVSKVQILVDGETPAVLQSSAYEADNSVVTTLEAAYPNVETPEEPAGEASGEPEGEAPAEEPSAEGTETQSGETGG